MEVPLVFSGQSLLPFSVLNFLKLVPDDLNLLHEKHNSITRGNFLLFKRNRKKNVMLVVHPTYMLPVGTGVPCPHYKPSNLLFFVLIQRKDNKRLYLSVENLKRF